MPRLATGRSRHFSELAPHRRGFLKAVTVDHRVANRRYVVVLRDRRDCEIPSNESGDAKNSRQKTFDGYNVVAYVPYSIPDQIGKCHYRNPHNQSPKR